jgi:hypothetical protein
MDLLRQVGRARRGVTVHPDKLPAAGIEQGQDDVSRFLIRDGMEIVARLDGDPQDGGADAGGGGRRGGGSFGDLFAAAGEEEQKEEKTTGLLSQGDALG